MSELRKNCAPGIQSDTCRICLQPIMEGNGARWAHDNCIEKEKEKDGRIHLPSPDEIEAICAEMRADRGHNLTDESAYDDSTTKGMNGHRAPKVYKLHAPSRRGRTIV